MCQFLPGVPFERHILRNCLHSWNLIQLWRHSPLPFNQAGFKFVNLFSFHHCDLRRDMDPPDLCVADHFLFSVHQFLEKINCCVVVGWQKDSDVCCEEIEYFSFGFVLCRELLRTHSYIPWLSVVYLLVLLVFVSQGRRVRIMLHLELDYY